MPRPVWSKKLRTDKPMKSPDPATGKATVNAADKAAKKDATTFKTPISEAFAAKNKTKKKGKK